MSKRAQQPLKDNAPWTPKDEALLRALYPCTRTDELPARFGRSRSAIKNRVAAMHLKKNPEASMHRPWSAADDAVIRELYPDTLTAVIAARLGRFLGSVHQRAAKLGLSKTAAFVASTARDRMQRADHGARAHQFKKGQVSHNKGMRHPAGWGPGRMKDTQFKKGTLNGRAVKVVKPIGFERINKDGYLERKINNDLPFQKRWRAVHLLVWEAANGPLPPSHAIAFKNGNRHDRRLDNLECITRADNMRRNTIHNLPKPLVETIHALGQLNRRIREKTEKDEKQNRRLA